MLKQILSRIERRLDATGQSATAASRRAGLTEDAIRNLRRAAGDGDGRSGISTATLLALAPVLGTTASWLLEGVGPEGERLVPIIGRAGLTADGLVIVRGAHEDAEFIEAQAAAGAYSAAIEVEGHGLGGLAENGGLVYFDDPRDPETLLRVPVVAKIQDGPMMITRLLRTTEPGLYEVEPLSGPAFIARVEWAAPVSDRVTPAHAAKIIRRTDPATRT